MLDAESAAWNRGDGASWASAFTEDADFVNILGQVFHGRAAIAEQHRRILAGPFHGSHAIITVRQITPIAAGAISVDALYEVTNYKFLPPGVVPTANEVLRTRMKYLAVDRGAGWQFIAAQNTTILPEFAPRN
jgi:uncharacterized protein (TIGR02246 family)